MVTMIDHETERVRRYKENRRQPPTKGWLLFHRESTEVSVDSNGEYARGTRLYVAPWFASVVIVAVFCVLNLLSTWLWASL